MCLVHTTPGAIPKLQPTYVNVLGINFSDKSFTYILGLQLMVNSGWRSIIPALTGIAAGSMFLSDALPFSSMAMPGFLSRLAQVCGARAPASACHAAARPVHGEGR